MLARRFFLLLELAFVVVAGVAVGGEWRYHERLGVEIARWERIRDDRVLLREKNAVLRAALAKMGDLKSLRDRRAGIELQRAAIDALKLQRRSWEKMLGLPAEAVWPAGVEVRRAGDWKFRGQANPVDAAESVLWAARAGDIDRLGGLIQFEPKARQVAETIFAGLPEQARVQYGSPEKIVATMLAAQLPADYAAMAPVRQTDASSDSALLTLRLEEGTGVQRDLELKFQKEEDAWRLDVPEAVVSRYAAQLEGSAIAK